MSLKHAILGFLSYKPFSGYDLKKAFDTSVQHFWPANQSQIYRTLSGMTEDGLVEMEVIEREDRLDKKIYHITEEGEEELHRWLSTPLPPQDTREADLIQFYFSGQLTDGEVNRLLENHLEQSAARLAVYRQMMSTFAVRMDEHPDQRAFFFNVLTLEYGLLGEQFMQEWLKSIRKRISEKDYSFRIMNTSNMLENEISGEMNNE